MANFLNLERLRKDAKTILKECRAGNAAAIDRMRAHLPGLSSLDNPQLAAQVKLADIQHALARERGYANWGELKRHDSPLERFLMAVRSGSVKAAQRELESSLELAKQSIHAACVIGDADAVRYHLDSDPNLIHAKHGEWPPLIYACASRLHTLTSRHAAGILECVSLLLDRGADPNTYTLADSSDPDSRIDAWSRAAASMNSEVHSLLRQRGATVSTGPISKATAHALQQSLYPEPPLFDALGKINQTDPRFNAEIRMRLAPVRDRFFSVSALKDKSKNPPALPLFLTEPDLKKVAIGLAEFALEHGINPNLAAGNEGNTFLHEFTRLKDYPEASGEAVEWLLSHGADPNIPMDDGQTPFVLAVRIGNTTAVEIMRAHGADIRSVTPADELMGACRNHDAAAAAEIIRRHPETFTIMGPEARELLVAAAADNRPTDVRFMVQLGFDPGSIGECGASALHVASWHGHVEVVRLLLELQAPVNKRDATFGTSPLAWAIQGSRNSSGTDDDYTDLVESLLNAGAEYASCVNRWGTGPGDVRIARMAALLRGHGFPIHEPT